MNISFYYGIINPAIKYPASVIPAWPESFFIKALIRVYYENGVLSCWLVQHLSSRFCTKDGKIPAKPE